MRRAAFTLLEVAVALAILTVGLTAATGCYITALRWAAEARYQLSALEAARVVLHQPGLLCDARSGGAPIGAGRDDRLAEGWFNGYYIVRQVTGSHVLPEKGGKRCDIELAVYAGGTAADGELVYTVETAMWWVKP